MLNALSRGVNVWAKLHIYRVNRLVANVHVETAHTWLHFSSYIFHIQDTHIKWKIYMMSEMLIKENFVRHALVQPSPMSVMCLDPSLGRSCTSSI